MGPLNSLRLHGDHCFGFFCSISVESSQSRPFADEMH